MRREMFLHGGARMKGDARLPAALGRIVYAPEEKGEQRLDHERTEGEYPCVGAPGRRHGSSRVGDHITTHEAYGERGEDRPQEHGGKHPLIHAKGKEHLLHRSAQREGGDQRDGAGGKQPRVLARVTILQAGAHERRRTR